MLFEAVLRVQTAFLAGLAQGFQSRIEGGWLRSEAQPGLPRRRLEPGRRGPACERDFVPVRHDRRLAAEQVDLQPNAVVVEHRHRDEIDHRGLAKALLKPGCQRGAIALGLRHVVGDQTPNPGSVQPGAAQDGVEVVGDDIGLSQQITRRLHPRASA